MDIFSRQFAIYPLAFIFAVLPAIALSYGILIATVLPLLGLFLLWYTGVQRDALPLLAKAGLVGFSVMAWPVLSSLWSLTPRVTLVTSLRMGGIIMFGVWLLILLKRKEYFPRIFASSFVAGLWITAVMLCSQMLPRGGIFTAATDIFDIDPNILLSKDINRGLCAMAVLAWPALLAVYAVGKRWHIFLMSFLIVAGVLGMHSLSAKVGVIAGVFSFYAVLYGRRAVAPVLLYSALLFVFAWPAVFYFGEDWIREHVYEHVPDSSKHRIEIWHFAMEKWQEKPFIGWGVDTSRVMPGGMEEVHPTWVAMPMHPHNAIIQILLEQGIIGLGLAFIAIVMALRFVLGMYQENALARAAITATVISYLMIGFSAFNLWQAWWVSQLFINAILIVAFLGIKVESLQES
jgi:O-antigen ligase